MRGKPKTVDDGSKTTRKTSGKVKQAKKAEVGRKGARKDRRGVSASLSTVKPGKNKGGACQSKRRCRVKKECGGK